MPSKATVSAVAVDPNAAVGATLPGAGAVDTWWVTEPVALWLSVTVRTTVWLPAVA